jgi:dTDP-4-amino-4,6-dideoxygalactose transaminase
MSAWRHQVPVSSPLSARALLSGVRAAVYANGADRGLEALLTERYAPRALLLTGSGTQALTLALLGLLCERAGPAVALPAYTCYDVATAAEGAHVPVVLYDVDPLTLAPDLESLRRAVRRGAMAVVVAHLYGYPVDLREARHIAEQHGALLIEDAAQAAGATVAGRPAGAQASLGVLSFGRGKGLTGGRAGALLAYDEAGVRAIERVRRALGPARRGWSELATLAAQLVLEHPRLYGVPAGLPLLHLGETIYRRPGVPRAPSGVACAIVAATWCVADREAAVRRRHAARLLAALRCQPAFETIRTPPHAQPGYLRLPVLAASAARRSAVAAAAKRMGVMPGYPNALCDVERAASRCLNRNAVFPGARRLAAELCTLPTHGRLREADLAGLERWVRDVGRVARDGSGAPASARPPTARGDRGPSATASAATPMRAARCPDAARAANRAAR